MIHFKDVTLRFGAHILLDQANLRIDTGNTVGLVGKNGAGKTSLLKLIKGELHEDHGHLSIPTTWRISHLEQELPVTLKPAFDYVRAGDTQWQVIQDKITQTDPEKDGLKLAELYHQLELIDGYTIDTRTAIIMKGLGFEANALHQPVNDFSGGWQMRLQLARTLMSRADLLLLDEPTNHLDLETILWLESWLKKNSHTTLIISHDRDFLDHVTNQIATISHKKMRLYQGNYSSYARQFQEALILQQKSNKKIEQQKKHLQHFVDRFKAKATKAKQAQSRVKAIEKLNISTDLQEEGDCAFSFFESTPTGYPTISIRGDLGYPHHTVLKQVKLNVGDGDRIGVIGVNGSGKSTLLKTLSQQLPLLCGELMHHPNIRMGYFSQHQVDTLHLDESPLDHLLQQDRSLTESQARAYLGRFQFTNNQTLSPIAPFSGGEKARLALALLINQKPNVLILDEPTNHLDMQVREAFIRALQDFQGAVLLVSHDRYFLECCANELWIVENHHVHPYSGNLDDYQRSQQQEQQAIVTHSPSSNVTPMAATSTPNKVQQKKIRQLEREINTLQKKIDKINTALADPALYEQNDHARITELTQQKSSLESQHDDAEQRWLTLEEEIEKNKPIK